MESRRNEKCPFLWDIKNTWVKNVTLYNSKEAPDVEGVVQAQGIMGLTKNDYNFLTSKCWFKIHCNGEWYSCLACLLEIIIGTHQNDVFHKLRTLMDSKYCPPSTMLAWTSESAGVMLTLHLNNERKIWSADSFVFCVTLKLEKQK